MIPKSGNRFSDKIMLKRNKRRTGRQSLTPSAASVVPLGDDRLPALAVVRVGLAVASAGRADGDLAGAEPRDADAGALRLIASARAALKITEQAADAADPQTSAAGLTKTGSFRTAASGRRDGDAERCNDQLSMEMAAHGRPDLTLPRPSLLCRCLDMEKPRPPGDVGVRRRPRLRGPGGAHVLPHADRPGGSIITTIARQRHYP